MARLASRSRRRNAGAGNTPAPVRSPGDEHRRPVYRGDLAGRIVRVDEGGRETRLDAGAEWWDGGINGRDAAHTILRDCLNWRDADQLAAKFAAEILAHFGPTWFELVQADIREWRDEVLGSGRAAS